MSANRHSDPTPTKTSGARTFCVLLVCFAGAAGASKARRAIDAIIKAADGIILDEVVLRVDAKRKARVYDPRRAWAGLLTSALTWGVFGLVTGGWESLGLWAVLGALGGGAYAYMTEHLLTKDELARVGRSMPADSSALTVYLHASNPQEILASVASQRPSTASIAAISDDLTAVAYNSPVDPSATESTEVDQLAMLLVRYSGEQASHDALQRTAPAAKKHAHAGSDVPVPQVELLIETDGTGRRRVIDPTTGARTTSRSDLISWGLFGVVWGAAAGFLGTSGIFGSVEKGFLTGVGYAFFGLVAGALYGLWVGRGVSARRLRRMGPILPPNTSSIVAWADEAVPPAEIEAWTAAGSDRLTLWFRPTGVGARLEV